MKPFLLLAAMFGMFPAAFSQLTLDGTYAGKNLYIQNPESGDLEGQFCTTSVLVNGHTLPDSLIHASAIEIPLNDMNLAEGDPVHIVIHHRDGCKPKVLQPISCHIYQPAGTAEVRLSYDKKQRTFRFSKPVNYTVYDDATGKPVVETDGASFDARSLPKGRYTVSYLDKSARIAVGKKEGICEQINTAGSAH